MLLPLSPAAAALTSSSLPPVLWASVGNRGRGSGPLKETERARRALWSRAGTAGRDSLMGLPSGHWVCNKGH